MCQCSSDVGYRLGGCTVVYPYPFPTVELPNKVFNDPSVAEFKTSQPHLCPVCQGRGILPPGFYNLSGVASILNEEICRSCGGLGYIIC